MDDRSAIYTVAPQRTRDGFVSFISAMSMASIALGVMALIIVLSVMNGFQKEVRDKMLSVLSHAEVLSIGAPIPDWQKTAAELKKQQPEIIGSSAFLRGRDCSRAAPTCAVSSSTALILRRNLRSAMSQKI